MQAGRGAARQRAYALRIRSMLARTLVAAIISTPCVSAQETNVEAPAEGRRDVAAGAAREAARRAEVAEMGPAVDVGGSALTGRERAVAAGVQPNAASDHADAADRSSSSSSVPAVSPVSNRSRVLDTLDLGTTSITGNQELPKVLYIVPWKQSDLGDLVGRPANTLLDEVLAPIDPEVFERHLGYYEILYGESHFGESRNGQSEEE